jgi:hypothetical protein
MWLLGISQVQYNHALCEPINRGVNLFAILDAALTQLNQRFSGNVEYASKTCVLRNSENMFPQDSKIQTLLTCIVLSLSLQLSAIKRRFAYAVVEAERR